MNFFDSLFFFFLLNMTHVSCFLMDLAIQQSSLIAHCRDPGKCWFYFSGQFNYWLVNLHFIILALVICFVRIDVWKDVWRGFPASHLMGLNFCTLSSRRSCQGLVLGFIWVGTEKGIGLTSKRQCFVVLEDIQSAREILTSTAWPLMSLFQV